MTGESSLNVKVRQRKSNQASNYFDCTGKITTLDMYRRPFYFLMPDRTEYYRSVLGTIFSFATIIIIVVNGSFRFVDLYSQSNYRLMEMKQELFFAESDSFGSVEGFNIAAGIVSFDGGTSGTVVDPEIGSLQMYMKSWNVYDETNGEVFFRPLKTRPCTFNDFNDLEGSNSESRFFRTESEWTLSAVKTYGL